MRRLFLFGIWLPLFMGGCSKTPPPDFFSGHWLAFQARFCTQANPLEVWETRDADKLTLLQGALTFERPKPLEKIVKSPNHALVVVLEGEQGPETWQLTLRLNQTSMAAFDVKQPERSFQAQTDPMLYRTLNTLLLSHMGESLDIYRRCEMP